MRGLSQNNSQGSGWLRWLLLAVAAVLVSLNPPGRGTNLVGLIAFVPFLVVLEWRFGVRGSAALGGADSGWRRFRFAFFSCYLLGIICVSFGMTWQATSVQLFGGQSQLVATLITGPLYGLEMGLLFFLIFALPLLVLRRTNGWDLGPRLLWALLVDAWYPRLVGWSFGGETFYKVPLIEQAADVVGAWGLGFFSIGANLLLAFLVSRWLFRANGGGSVSFIVGGGMLGGGTLGGSLARSSLPRVFIAKAYIYGLLFAAALLYGAYFEFVLSRKPAPAGETTHLRLVSVQPNFSYERFAKAAKAFPGEPLNMETLLSLSRRGLAALPPQPAGEGEAAEPNLVVWPESAFPWPLLNSDANRAKLGTFAREHNTALMLGVYERQPEDGKRKPKALSLLFNAKGELTGRYEKITLMPFGEYIPIVGNLPGIGDWVRDSFPMISEFEAGEQPTVFELGSGVGTPGDGVRVGGAICFDAVNPSVYRGMAGGGAQLIVNLTNMSWFGYSDGQEQLESELRWRSIENRVPVLLSTLTGVTKLMKANGKQQGQSIENFSQGVLAERLELRTYGSFYAAYEQWLKAAAFVIFILLVGVGTVYGRLFATTIDR